MTYQQFISETKKHVEQSLDARISIKIHTAYKNNSTERIGLIISDPVSNVSPTIYLEEYFKQYQKGYTIERIASDIVYMYQNLRTERSWDVSNITTFSAVENRIAFKLVSYSKNIPLLTNIPHIPYLDLAITFYILFENDQYGTATIPITKPLLKLWDVSLETLLESATKNTPLLLKHEFQPLREAIDHLLDISYSEDQDYSDSPLFLLTNTMKTFGASCILYKGLLQEIGEYLDDNFFVIPSSIHEVIIVPEKQSPEREEMNAMIEEVNATQMEEEEILSDHVYYFDLHTRTLS